MIPHVEDILVAELERRICEAMPETAPGVDGEAETFVTTFESRKFTPCIQEQGNITVYGEVEAEISVVLYSHKQRYDYTPLYVSFAKNTHIKLADGISACVSIDKCEAVEGPYLSNDAWLFKATYYIFDIEDVVDYAPPHLGTATTDAPDIYPRPVWDARNEPEAHI